MTTARTIDLGAALAEIRAAAATLAPQVRRTPTIHSQTFSESAGAEVFLKLENLQRTGSFKLRGALCKVASLSPEVRARGLIAASAGNHAQGVALAARLFDAPALIVMPERTPLIKIQRTESYGAEVVLAGESWDESHARALALARERDLTLVHAFDDPIVIAGQGTVGLEIMEDVERLDALIVPVGGGGLVAGIALAVKAIDPKVRVIGVQASGADAFVRSLREGRKVEVGDPRTIADGIRLGTIGDIPFAIARELLDDCVTVEDSEIIAAVVETIEKSKIVAETAGVAAIAALATGKIRGLRRVCAVVSGGNIDSNLLARIIESGLSDAGRYHLVRLRLADVPGELARIVAILAESKCNILEVQHYRAGWKVPVGSVDVEILVETRRSGQGVEIDRALTLNGFEPRR